MTWQNWGENQDAWKTMNSNNNAFQLTMNLEARQVNKAVAKRDRDSHYLLAKLSRFLNETEKIYLFSV